MAPSTNLEDSERQQIAIFTTASLPLMTGTAVNPLFRAAYLAKDVNIKVTLVLPWLSLDDQKLVYPNKITFPSPAEQEEYIHYWVGERTGFTSSFCIRFYAGKFSAEKRSILPIGDLTDIILDEEADIAVLEEPEHLTWRLGDVCWYHHGRRWKNKFQQVIGIVHTNYLEYVKREKNKQVQAFLLKYINGWVTQIYCHKVIRLSSATQELPRSVICNVHGVKPKFITIGNLKQEKKERDEQVFTKGAYYIGKMVWSKGYRELLQLLTDNQNELPDIEIDLYGSGEDYEEVQQAVKDIKLIVRVHSGRDHADSTFHDYKVFINPSTTDVLCTTTAEALAMGKIVVCAKHPSNEFFEQFSNCRMYTNNDEFVKATLEALSENPSPLTEKERHELTWEAATERFLSAADLKREPSEKPLLNSTPLMALSLRAQNLTQKIEDASAFLHFTISGNETARRFFGAIPRSLEPDEQLCKELGLFTEKRQASWRW